MNKRSYIIQNILTFLLLAAVCALCVICARHGIPYQQAAPVETVPPAQTAVPVTPEPEPEPVILTPSEPTAVETQEPEPPETAEPEEEPDPLDLVDPLAAELIRLTNDERGNANLPLLTYAPELQEAADLRAYEASVQFSHTRPNGTSCHSVMDGFDYYVVGENLLMADKPIAVPRTMMDAWMNSQGHRDNILLPDYTKIAIGIWYTDDVVYAAQLFLGE